MKIERHTWAGLRTITVGPDEPTKGSDGLVVVLLHGFGAGGDDLVPMAGEIPTPPGTRFVFPAAPLELPAAYGDARAWWMIDILSMQRENAAGHTPDLRGPAFAGLLEARAKVVAFVEEVRRRMPGPLVLGGFSQGAILAVDVGLRIDPPPVALLAMSGAPVPDPEWPALIAARRGLKVLQSHGRHDEVLPYSLGELLRQQLTTGGLAVDFVPFNGGHTIPAVVIDRIGALLE